MNPTLSKGPLVLAIVIIATAVASARQEAAGSRRNSAGGALADSTIQLTARQYGEAPRAQEAQHEDELERFAAFRQRHGRTYAGEELAERYSIWKANTEAVRLLNDQSAAKGGATFTANGPFGDLTPQEFADSVLMPQRRAPMHPPENFLAPRPSGEPLPVSFDWRGHGAVSAVKDQGFLGSCWAFSTAGNIEGQVAASGGTLVDLSVEQLIECDAGADPAKDSADCGEFGGWPYLAYQYLETAGGVYTDLDFPYCSGVPYGGEGNCMPCMPPSYNKKLCGDHSDLYCNASSTLGQGPSGLCKDAAGAGVQVTGWNAVPQDEVDMAKQLVALGPLSAAMNAALLQFYYSGIYDPYDYWCQAENLDHAVLLVGFGTEAGKDFWTVKNSWGSGWGEDGFFRIKRGEGKCGIHTAVTTAHVTATSVTVA